MPQYTAWIVRVHTEKAGLELGQLDNFEDAEKAAELVVKQLDEGQTPRLGADTIEVSWEEDDQTYEVDDIIEE